MRPVLQKQDLKIIRYALSFLLANLDDTEDIPCVDELGNMKENVMGWTGTPDELDVRLIYLRRLYND
jgi:hypothetical protein